MQKEYDLYPSEYNFKCFTHAASICLQLSGPIAKKLRSSRFCDFKHRVIITITE